MIGDFGGGGPGATENAASIKAAGTDFIQTVGDNVYPSSGLPDPDFATTYSDFDQRFFKPFGPTIKDQGFFPANGNKEYYGDGQWWDAFPMHGSNHSWYSYNWGDAHILVLDTEVPLQPWHRAIRLRRSRSRCESERKVADCGDAWPPLQLNQCGLKLRWRTDASCSAFPGTERPSGGFRQQSQL